MELNKKQERTISEVNPSIFRRFPFSPKRKGSTTFSGRFQSRFIGQGYEFYGLREYQLGDDARKIHWKHYAKTDELNIREDVIESNIRMWVLQDLSASMDFGEKPILGDVVVEDFRSQSQAVEKAEDEHGDFRVRLKAEPALECA